MQAVCQRLQLRGLLGGQYNTGCLGCVLHMGDLRNADDGQRALCNGPGHGDLGRPDAVLVCQLPQRCVQNRKLIQNGVVNGCALRTRGHGVPGVVLAGQRALFKHHVREEDDAVFPAVVQDARVFRRAVDQTVMVLHRRELQSVGLQNLVGLLDLGQIVVGDAKQRCVLLALEVPASSSVQCGASHTLWIQ